MQRRLTLVFLPLLYVPISSASDAAWNCEQDKNTKEWLCVGDKKPAVETADEPPVKKLPPVVSTRPESPIDAITPALQHANPVKTAPIVAETPRPVPTPIRKPVEPVITQQAEEMTPAVKPEPPPIGTRTPPTVKADADVTPIPAGEPASDESEKERPARTVADRTVSNSTGKTAGWNCDGDSKGNNEWNCELIGTDPKGQARRTHVVETASSTRFSLLDPAFDATQEQNFAILTGRMKSDPWENGGIPDVAGKKVVKESSANKKTLRQNSPIELTSDFAEIFDNEIGNYLGNVDIKRADQHSLSHIANYDSVSKALDLSGDVYFNEDELALYGRSASVKLESDQSKLRDALFISPAKHLRGSSSVVYRDSKTFSRYKDVSYTSCRPGNQDWVLHASELKMNDELARGAVKNAWVEFKGVPIFYTPYLSFSTNNERATGFLPPSFHYTKQGGVGLYTPFYWNIAPNYDALFTPRYLSSRGLLLDTKFRYLTEMTKGVIKTEYMPHDSQLHKARYLGSITNSTVFTPNLTANLDANFVSDKNYFSQLGNALSLPTNSFLRSTADINYYIDGMSLTARADNYQSISPAITTLPYRRLPQINLNLNHAFRSSAIPFPINVTMENESIYFQHGSFVNGNRLNTKPSISMPWQNASAFITPKISLQHTEYLLNRNAVNTNSNISRTLPIASLDAGVFFEKELNIGGSSMLHTLEPRLFYLYVPYRNQSNIPIFDSAQYDFGFNNLFRENRYAGSDRIQDANQVSLALTSRLVDPATGQEKLKVNVGDIFYFKNRNVTLSSIYANVPYSVQETSWSSPIIADVSSQLTEHVSADVGTQWDPHSNVFTRGRAGIHYINQGERKILNAGFLYRRNPLLHNAYPLNHYQAVQDDIVQSDASMYWPISDEWSVVGRWQYSWLYNRTQEGFFGVEKENCCWRFRLIGRRYMNTLVNTTDYLTPGLTAIDPNAQAQTGVFFQIELKGLMGLGEKLDTFFERNIFGYRSTDRDK